MCLDLLKKYFYPNNLYAVVGIISIIGFIITECLIGCVLLYESQLGLAQLDDSRLFFTSWFFTDIIMMNFAFISVILVWSNSVMKGCVARDILLNAFTWLIMVGAILHVGFCVTLLIVCRNKCLVTAGIHFGIFVLALIVLPFMIIVVNSWKKSESPEVGEYFRDID